MTQVFSWICTVGCFFGTLLLIREKGLRPAMRLAWLGVLLWVPAWFKVLFRSFHFDPASSVAAAILLVMMLRPGSSFRPKLLLSDFLILFAAIVPNISDLARGFLIPGFVFDNARNWIFPYLMGRIFLESPYAIRSVLPVICFLTIGISLFGIFEAFAKVNILAKLSGISWELLEGQEGFRWGLKRAQGNLNHPIYFGLMLALFLPWLLLAGRESLWGTGPSWWIAAPILAVIAAICSVSRSAQLVLLFIFITDAFFRRPNWRPAMIALAVVGAMLFLTFRDDIIDFLSRYAGEEANTQEVKIYGKKYPYTGTAHRDLLILAYEEPAEKAGFLGYGTEFKDMPIDPLMDHRFRSIDHHYLLYYLKYGYLGVASLLAVACCCGWYIIREAWSGRGPTKELAAGLCGAFWGVVLILRGIAMEPDFGWVWLFVAGMAASMRVMSREPWYLPPVYPQGYYPNDPNGMYYPPTVPLIPTR